MKGKAMRKRLTDNEFNAVSTLTYNTHLDEVFDIGRRPNGDDGFYDYESCRWMSLKHGFNELYDAIAYPFSDDGLNKEEGNLIINLFKEFKVGDEEGYKWLMEESK